MRIMLTVNSHHTGAYAAQAAYFFVLSLIPILLLLVYMAVRYTPLNQNDVLNAVLQVFSGFGVRPDAQYFSIRYTINPRRSSL